MPLYEIAVDGVQHSGSYSARADAERGLAAVVSQFPGRRVEVLERADGAGLARYAGRDANGLPVTTVPLEAQSATDGQAPGEIQRPSDGMLPGPGGAVQTESLPGASTPGESRTLSPPAKSHK